MPKRAQPTDRALGAVIRQMREERGESLESLAYRSGLNSGSLGNIELARSVPSWATVRAIATALDVSLLDLVAAVEEQGAG